ncbi:epoxyqueuosine reductase [Methanoregula sp.]|uniref:epoxyqueuosine reductase n=1 Tax=Methanoregula sp. TaxID=2052170 RepID=UPI002C2839A8|nr:epoxyqueuosine reductase [Methanoregula sp.]HVP96265.1 epoxyqueuosine reductase [Methanoregula sp.]
MTPHHQDKTDRNDPALWIETAIREFCETSPENDMHYPEREPLADEPLVGFSSAADPLYEHLKQDIGAPCMTPLELFRAAFPDTDADAGDLTVISWILPQTTLTKDENGKETQYPSERWARAKHYGGIFTIALMKYLTGVLADRGIPAVAPALSPEWTLGVSEKYGIASSWSERHAAYVSGLGTFGLCDGLITRKGKAMRCGSLVARITIPPTPRPYTDHRAWCLYYAKGTCKLCIKRCPAGAISEQGHDKNRCREYCFGVAQDYVHEQYHIDNYGCGLCQAGVPCESKNPVRPKKGDRAPA